MELARYKREGGREENCISCKLVYTREEGIVARGELCVSDLACIYASRCVGSLSHSVLYRFLRGFSSRDDLSPLDWR